MIKAESITAAKTITADVGNSGAEGEAAGLTVTVGADVEADTVGNEAVLEGAFGVEVDVGAVEDV